MNFGQPSGPFEWMAVRNLANRLQATAVAHELPALKFVQGEVKGRNEAFVNELARHIVGPSLIGLGIHAGCEYEDTQPPFVARMQQNLDVQFNGQIRLDCPLLSLLKADVVVYAQGLGVSLEETYSCDAGDPGQCGSCRSCQERRNALETTTSPILP